MLSTDNLNFITDIPDTWIFEKYLNLSETLTGQNINMLSVFNSKDSNPSMHVFVDHKDMKYKFKDFSSGYFGDGINLVQYLYNLNYSDAIKKIQSDFSKGNVDVTKRQIQIHDKYKVSDYQIRFWNKADAEYWKAYKIDSKLLEAYNIYPLSYYVMSKKNLDGTIQSFVNEKLYVYGFFTKEGVLYKIYQPKIKDQKYIKVTDYIQGHDQLEFKAKYLLLNAGLKDLLCFKKLKIGNIESIAPDSENKTLTKNQIEFYQSKYSKLIVLFDNDEAGKKAALKYKELYNIEHINFNLDKDLAEALKNNDLLTVKQELWSLLKKQT